MNENPTRICMEKGHQLSTPVGNLAKCLRCGKYFNAKESDIKYGAKELNKKFEKLK